MSEQLDRVFPPEQCLPEPTMEMVEDILGVDAVWFFMCYGPIDDERRHDAHIEAPFQWLAEDCRKNGIIFEGLNKYVEELAQIRMKLPRQTPPR